MKAIRPIDTNTTWNALSEKDQKELSMPTHIDPEPEPEPEIEDDSRAAHLKWCKDRALEYVDVGDCKGACSSMLSDLSKHPETKDHAAIELMAMLLMSGNLNAPAETRRFIEGFN